MIEDVSRRFYKMVNDIRRENLPTRPNDRLASKLIAQKAKVAP